MTTPIEQLKSDHVTHDRTGVKKQFQLICLLLVMIFFANQLWYTVVIYQLILTEKTIDSSILYLIQHSNLNVRY